MRRISIRTLDISTRTRNALLRGKIEYLDDLVNMSDKDIMLKTPIGEKGIKEVRAVIKKYLEENKSNYIEIEGVVETYLDHQAFLDKFIEWVEMNGWSYGGDTREVNEEGDSVVSNKLSEIKERALQRKNNSTLRHDPNEIDIKIANKNFEDLEQEVYSSAQEKSMKESQLKENATIKQHSEKDKYIKAFNEISKEDMKALNNLIERDSGVEKFPILWEEKEGES